jgi:GNAT superfamily N-acetyltransferase
MKIIDLNEKYLQTFACCFEDWSDEMTNAAPHTLDWYEQLKEKGLRVKIALDNEDNAVGLIRYLPAEYSFIYAPGFYFVLCIWVHGYKDKGVGNKQKQGIGKALLNAAEEDVKAIGAKGIAAWGLSEPFWMPTSFYKKFGYKVADSRHIMELVYKPFTKDVNPPKWLNPKKPVNIEGKTVITALISGWCTGYNVGFQNFRKAAKELGVEFKVISTLALESIREWKQTDAIYIDDEEIALGPPPSYEDTLKIIQERIG